MRGFVLILLFLPFAVNAQLDRMRTDMNETEFVKEFPEAIRDYDAESAWVKADSVSAVSVRGQSQWRFCKDTVVAYHFTSYPVKGPTEHSAGIDSTEVHRMKESADAIRKGIEMAHGKPATFKNVPLTAPNPMENPVVYLAEWHDDANNVIRIMISAMTESGGSYINAPVRVSPPSPKYEMYIVVTMRSQHTYLRYGVGQPSSIFFLSNTELLSQSDFRNNHQYTISDSSTVSNAAWRITFVKDQLVMIGYGAYFGTEYGAKSDNDAYAAGRKKTSSIFSDAKKAFGKTDTVEGTLPAKRSAHSLIVAYSEIWHRSYWKPKGGYAALQFMEIGGGKNPAIIYSVTFVYERRD